MLQQKPAQFVTADSRQKLSKAVLITINVRPTLKPDIFAILLLPGHKHSMVKSRPEFMLLQT
jgi:hypothetical protein